MLNFLCQAEIYNLLRFVVIIFCPTASTTFSSLFYICFRPSNTDCVNLFINIHLLCVNRLFIFFWFFNLFRFCLFLCRLNWFLRFCLLFCFVFRFFCLYNRWRCNRFLFVFCHRFCFLFFFCIINNNAIFYE